MKERRSYLEKLISFKDKPFIKVITGIRRCGKSTLMDLYEQYLLSVGILQEQIIRMNFESLEFDEIKTYKEFNQAITGTVQKGKRYYLLLDEVQQVEKWEKAVNSFLVNLDCDIYITGSNAYLLSSELSTLLSGRYVEIKMLPLSFVEYLDFCEGEEDRETLFLRYMEYGGLPAVTMLNYQVDVIQAFLSGIFNTVIVKDVVQRGNVRDVPLLESIVRYLADNIGNIVSTKKISDYLTSAGRKTSSETVDNYIKMLEDAFVLYKVNRFDIKGKLYLKTLEKYYIVDTGIRGELLGFRQGDYGHILENIVFLELIRRGYKVSIGKMDEFEIDFVAESPNEKMYVQVSASILDDQTRKRELRPLQAIKDNYRKIILTMDKMPIKDFEGIEWENIIEFLYKQ